LTLSAELEQLLEKEASVGETVSTDGFTLNSWNARRKMAEHQLPEAGLWVVKFVQAGVALKATSVQVVLGRREVEITLNVGRFPYSVQELLNPVLAGTLSNEPFLFHFSAGLLGSLAEDTLTSELEIRRGGTITRIHFSVEETRLSEQECEEGGDQVTYRTARPPRWPGLKRASVMPLMKLVNRTADEYMAVHSYCWPSPVPVAVDGRIVGNGYRPAPAVNEDRYGEISLGYASSSKVVGLPVVLARRELQAPPGRPPFRIDFLKENQCRPHPENREIELSDRLYFGRTFMKWDLPEGPVGAYLFILLFSEMDSRVDFVCDGAVVATHPLPWSSFRLSLFGQSIPQNQYKVGVRLVVPVQTGELDLSHFAIRDSEEFQEKLADFVHQPLLETLKELRLRLKETDAMIVPPDRESSFEQGLVTLIRGLQRLAGQGIWSRVLQKEMNSLIKSVEEWPESRTSPPRSS